MQVVGNNGGRGWWEHCLVLENSCCKQIGIGLAGAFGLGQSDSRLSQKDISQNRRSELNALTNQPMASAVDRRMQMKQAHWKEGKSVQRQGSFCRLHPLIQLFTLHGNSLL